MVNLKRICKDFKSLEGLPLDSVDPGGVPSTVNLKRIHKDFVMITSANVDPRGVSTNSHHGKDVCRLWSTFQVHHQSTLPPQINIV